MTWSFYGACVLVILGIAFFIIFREEIRKLIQNIRKIEKSGLTLYSAQKESPTDKDPKAEAEALMREFDSALLREMEDYISQDLRQRNLTGAEAVPVLVRHMATAYISLSFEATYRLIWGSQLAVIVYLNAHPGQPVDAMRTFYVVAASQYPALYQGYPFETWLGFLKDSVLVREDGGALSITVRGREFLLYLTQNGYTMEKAG